MVSENKINSRGAKRYFGNFVMATVCAGRKTQKKLQKKKVFFKESNTEAIKEIVQSVINANEKVVADYKAGNENSKISNGTGNERIKRKCEPTSRDRGFERVVKIKFSPYFFITKSRQKARLTLHLKIVGFKSKNKKISSENNNVYTLFF
ncbi:MAG: hypothetical protein R3B65_03030 [Candidatus Paceibacterota bacterium]